MTAVNVLETEDEGLAAGVRALEQEALALKALAESLDENFVQAVAILGAAKGRVVVTGMGKNGHIGNKIAATLASTGTPSYFVHPGEASHGDLGMVTRDDVVLALSNSGETVELTDFVTYCRRFSIPLVAITARRESMLARAADVLLLLPPVAEACPLGLAPTTSTTMTLALGDALAIALIEKRHFTATDFRKFHPGGALGKRLMTVRDLMHGEPSIPLATPETPMSEALLTMSAKGFGCVGVVDADGKLIGIITDGDLRRHMNDSLLTRHVGEVMTPHPRSVLPSLLAAEAVGRMNDWRVTNLFVVEEDRPVGVLHLHDCLRAGIV
ncbi:MAG: KpsF/GutQ family sugar-phosphate isomerase [Alphaproteobacteria bacterium]|nr:MAG: KpsF/GutQ family sugar-phosphate isomerase [Alphaproteobacteria bacterium]